jgi:hypothetical protein
MYLVDAMTMVMTQSGLTAHRNCRQTQCGSQILCLMLYMCNRQYTNKCTAVPLLNLAPNYEDVLGSGGIAPRILDRVTRRR